LLHTEARERGRQAAGPRHEVGVCVAVQTALDLRHDLFAREELLHPPDDVVQREREVLHQSFHRGLRICCVWRIMLWSRANMHRVTATLMGRMVMRSPGAG